MRHIVMGFGFVCLCLSATTSQANLVVNGDFETGDLSGWTSTGNVYAKNIQNSWMAAFNWSDTSPNGVMSQSFITTPGVAYDLRFDFGVVTYVGLNQTLKVEVNGATGLLSQFVSDPNVISGGPLTFDHYAFTFIADSSLSVVLFRDLGSNNTVATDSHVDNVEVTDVRGAAVPEIDAAGLGAAVAMIAAVFGMRERRRSRALARLDETT